MDRTGLEPAEPGRPGDLQIRVLGPLEVRVNERVLNLGGPKQRALLALLVAGAGDRLSTGLLVEEIYGEDASPRARRSIQTYVSNLRREMSDAIVSDGRGYRLSVRREQIDAMRFDDLRSRASDLVDSDPAEAADLLREALSLWRGHPYADIDTRGFLAAEIARLQEARLDAVELRIDAELAVGRHLQLISELQALTIEFPLRERFRAQQMIALYRAGRQGDALRAYARTREYLVEELGVEPSEELQGLELKILEHDDSLIGSVSSVVERVAVLAAEHVAAGRTPMEREAAGSWRDRVFTEQARAHGGGAVDVRHNTTYASFPSVQQALEAASGLPLDEFRVAVDFGAVDVADHIISGPPVSRALRLAAVAHPGQVVVTEEAQRSLADAGARGWTLSMLGRFEIHGVGDRILLFQLAGDGHPDHPPLLIDRLPPPLRQRSPGVAAGYELRDVLGEGVGGTVFRAYQPSLGREAAVRVVRRDLVGDLRFIRRFEAEMQRILGLSHPSIVPVLDFWREPAGAFIVSRLVMHPSLAETERPLGRSDANRLITHIGEALSYGHAVGTVHGRVGPNEILIDETGHPVLLDFGMALLFGDLVQYPADAYTAPEVIDGRPTVRSDIYSLAVLSAELLSGRPIPPDGPLPTTGSPFEEAIARATAPDPNQRHPDVESFLSDLLRDAPGTSPIRRELRNPFKGLSPFTEADAGDFHGRRELVEKLTGSVERNRFTAVVGSSGIGKSSVVLAGLVPRLRARGDLLVATMRPGAHPFVSLAEALGSVAVAPTEGPVASIAHGEVELHDALRTVLPPEAELVLIIDQFEELFTLASGKERVAFLGSMVETVTDGRSPLRVVATMRADYYDRPLEYPTLGELFAENTLAVHALDSQEWRSVITAPAEGVGVSVDDTLVDAIVVDVDSNPGSLPLVQHALRQMFASRDEDRLSLDAYVRSGGLSGWIDRTAERLYRDLSDEEQKTARLVFSRLVTVNEETEDARRVARQSDLVRAGVPWEAVQTTMGPFIENRLVVTGREPTTREPTIEVAHEALIHHWERFAGWIDAIRADLLASGRIERAAIEWVDANRSEAFLFRGERLAHAEEWARSNPSLVGAQEEEFLAAARAAGQRESEIEQRRRRRTIVGLSTALVVSLTLAVLAWGLRNVAETRAIESRVIRLTREAELALEDDPQLAMLLALEAYGLSDGLDAGTRGEVAAALQVTSQTSRLVSVIPHGRSLVEASPDGRFLIVDAGDDTDDILVYDQTTLEEVARFDVGASPAEAAFSPDGSTVAVVVGSAGRDGEPTLDTYGIHLYETGTFRPIEVLDDTCCPMDPQFSADGQWIKTDNPPEGVVDVWSTADRTRRRWLSESSAPARWLPEGHALVLASPDGTALETLDPATGERLPLRTLPTSEIDWIAVHPSSGSVVTTGESIDLWDLNDVRPEWSISEAGLFETEFSRGGTMVAAYGGSEQVVVTSTANGESLSLRGHWGGVRTVSFSRDDDHLFTLDSSGVKVWDLRPEGAPSLGNLAVGRLSGRTVLMASPDGRRLSVVESSGDTEQIAVHDVHHDRLLARSVAFSPEWGPVASHSGRFAGGLLDDTTGAIQDLETGELVAVTECRTPLAVSDDGRYAAMLDVCSIEDDTHVLLTDLETNVVLTRWVGLLPTIGPAGTPADGLIAYATPPFDTVTVLSLESGDLLGSLSHGVRDARFPRFSPDGKYLTFGSRMGGGVVIDVEQFVAGTPLEEAVVLRAVVESGTTAAAVAGGGYAATTHSGDEIRLWDIESGAEWATIPLGAETQSDAIITGDSRFLYYQDRPGVIARMPLDLNELADLVRSRVFRDFTAAECVRFEIEEGCAPSELASDPGR